MNTADLYPTVRMQRVAAQTAPTTAQQDYIAALHHDVEAQCDRLGLSDRDALRGKRATVARYEASPSQLTASQAIDDLQSVLAYLVLRAVDEPAVQVEDGSEYR